MGQGSTEVQRLREYCMSIDDVQERLRRRIDALEDKQARLAKLIARLERKVAALENPSGASPSEVKARVTRRVAAGKKGKA